MGRLRVAVVGLGKMVLLHASILSVMPSVEVIALCDKSWLLLKFVKKLFKKAQAVDDVEKLADLDLDLGRKFFSRQTTRLVDMKKLLKRQKLSIAKIAALTKDF
jgi:threonine dehydrogenase-like Zn-dependent dehydrogenase